MSRWRKKLGGRNRRGSMRQYRTRHILGPVSNRIAGRSQGSLTGAAGLVLRALAAGAAGGGGQSRGRQGQEGSHESNHREIMWGENWKICARIKPNVQRSLKKNHR